MIQPNIIRGPAVVIFDTFAYYVKGDIKTKFTRGTWTPECDMFGKLGPHVTDLGMYNIDFTPAGEIKSLAKFFPWGPSNLVAASPVGNSIYGAPESPKTLVIHTKAGKTHTFSRAGCAKMPSLILSPRKTAFGAMSFHALGKAATAPSDEAFFKAVATAAFADTSFDETKLVTGLYAAALGARQAPFSAMGARDGFELEPSLEIEQVPDDNIGIADEIITAISWKLKFAPSNLTEADFDALLQMQDDAALLPGQRIGNAGEDLVITGDALNVTLHNCGPVTGENGYGLKVDGNGAIEFANNMTFTTGAPDPLVTIALPS